MYGLVPYNLSPIQQGIQFTHAVVEHLMNPKLTLDVKNNMLSWARNDKTVIVLNGGTTNYKAAADGEGFKYKGSLNNCAQWLYENKIEYSTFNEPDLGDQLTAVVFLVDERVWNTEKYPDFKEWLDPEDKGVYNYMDIITTLVNDFPKKHQEYVKYLGGERNANIRQWLKQFKLA